jgi:acyl-homoserine lactone acylase PvdQ
MFGLGYVAAEDRLFFIDVLRHAGRADLSSFAGGSNQAMDEEQWRIAPYTEADLQSQVDRIPQLYGADGQRVYDDATAYVAGINQYINEAKLSPATKMPGEYAAIGRPEGPDPWKTTDIIAIASLVGGIFGKGGGNELAQVELRRTFRDRFGATAGERLWRDFAGFDDPDAPTTVKHRAFRYQTGPRGNAGGALALPDAGSVTPEPIASRAAGRAARAAGPGMLGGLLAFPGAMSNALVVSAARSAGGHPTAVFGPQTGYFAPQILMEQDAHGPGIDARGAAFPGVNLYVELGHGRDYAWSATSAGQDIIDTFAVPLCNSNGSTPTTDSDHYLFRGQCLPFEVMTKTNAWTPNAGDQTPPGNQTLTALRTKIGLVTARGTVGGRPVAYTSLRSTYFHEVDSALGFSDFNDPNKMKSPQDFQRAAYKIGYTFNWLYADDRDIAYFNSGNNPIRARGTNGQLPIWAGHEWSGFQPLDVNTARYTPPSQHPQVINQDYITSWNNRQAPGFAGADSNLYSSVFRSQLLDTQIDKRLANGQQMTVPRLIDAMEEAGTTDLRAERVLPYALAIIGTPSDPAAADAVSKLTAWLAAGGERRDRDQDHVYEHTDAIRIMDAWFPKLLEAEFEPTMGAPLFDRLRSTYEFDNVPNNHGAHLGSSWQNGWEGYANKDLRAMLGLQLKRPYATKFCGGGVLSACRTALIDSLKDAADDPASQVYPSDGHCPNAGDQYCLDEVWFRTVGGVTQPLIHWINRPTYQQAVQVQGHRPR